MDEEKFETIKTSLEEAGFNLVTENSMNPEKKKNVICVLIGVNLSALPTTVLSMIESGEIIHAMTEAEAYKKIHERGLLDLPKHKDSMDLINNIMKSAEKFNEEHLAFIDHKVVHAGGNAEYKRKKQSEKYRSRR